jgi:DNA-binding transcriptional MerR regulator
VRTYGPTEMARAARIAGLRALGLSLAQVERVLAGDPQGLAPALADHQAALEARMAELAAAVDKVRGLRAGLARGEAPDEAALAGLDHGGRGGAPALAFDLPWPWGGERFELRELKPLTFIVGPLGSGKTRLAQRIAETLPDAVFLPMDRAEGEGLQAAHARLAADPALQARFDQALAWLAEEGVEASDALIVLLTGLQDLDASAIVVDMAEEGLDEATQEALIAHLRRRGPVAPPLFLMTRSTAILDLAALGPDEAILFCPANHSPPSLIPAWAGAPGQEAVASCLAAPEVRARTHGVIAWRPPADA